MHLKSGPGRWGREFDPLWWIPDRLKGWVCFRKQEVPVYQGVCLCVHTRDRRKRLYSCASMQINIHPPPCCWQCSYSGNCSVKIKKPNSQFQQSFYGERRKIVAGNFSLSLNRDVIAAGLSDKNPMHKINIQATNQFCEMHKLYGLRWCRGRYASLPVTAEIQLDVLQSAYLNRGKQITKCSIFCQITMHISWR